MSKAGVQMAINKIAGDLYAIAQSVLEDDTVSTNIKTGENTLKNSQLKEDLYVAIDQENNDPVIGAFFNHYVVYLEWTRPPKYGKQPPIDALKDWASKNGIPTDTDTLWSISYAIWRDGHQGRPIFATIDKVVDELFYTDWSDKLFTALTDVLDNIFND